MPTMLVRQSALDAIRSQGRFLPPGTPDLETRHVATKDIASSATKLLTYRSRTGQGGLAVLGPEDISFDETAAGMSEVLGRLIRFQPITSEAYRSQLIQHGANEVFADQLTRMFIAKANGLDDAEARTKEDTTPITFLQSCREVLKPAFEG